RYASSHHAGPVPAAPSPCHRFSTNPRWRSWTTRAPSTRRAAKCLRPLRLPFFSPRPLGTNARSRSAFSSAAGSLLDEPSWRRLRALGFFFFRNRIIHFDAGAGPHGPQHLIAASNDLVAVL